MRVVVVDDSRSFRDSLVSMLESEEDIDVVAEEADGAGAVRAALAHQPDVVLMDLSMPGMDGIEATRLINGSAPHVGVVALTLRADDDAVLAALSAGARGYVIKGSRRAEIVWAIRAVGSGEAVFGPAVAARIARLLDRAAPRSSAGPLDALTEREQEVLELMAQHRSNAQIARALDISDKTVRNHVSNILTKLQARDRAEAILTAREHRAGGTPG